MENILRRRNAPGGSISKDANQLLAVTTSILGRGEEKGIPVGIVQMKKAETILLYLVAFILADLFVGVL